MLAFVLLVLVLVLYVMYSVWIVLTPLVSSSHDVNVWLASHFVDRYWGLAVPITLGVILLSVALGLYARMMR